jgi:HAD superfamily hydrolase (TIGR01509 family)
MFTAAIFDMDGLLIDSERAIMQAWQCAAAQQGVEISSAQYVQMIGRSRAECFDILTGLLGGAERFESARTVVQQHLRDELNFIFPAKQGAAMLLARLCERGVACAVASSSSLTEIQHRLRAVGVAGFFSAMAGGDEVAQSKPDPAVYQLAAARLAQPAETCLAFEDSGNGIRAALAAGMQVVAVPDLVRAEIPGIFRELRTLEEALNELDRWFP